MRLAPAAEFAVRGAITLAEHYGQGPLSLHAICAQRGLSKEYLSKIFAALVRADLIEAVRGKRGGYVLARAPKDISVLEVIEAVEGPIALNFCQHDPPKCDAENCCLREVWADVQRIMRRRLGAVSLASCVQRQAR